MHKIAPQVQSLCAVPLLHIGDVTSAAIRAKGIQKIGLLGTRFTMEQAFMRECYASHGIEAIVPNDEDRTEVHRIIFEELCRGEIIASSKAKLITICKSLSTHGAQGIVLGCTELTMILNANDAPLPFFDTMALHASAAVDFALAE
jgi:aspartate racemase